MIIENLDHFNIGDILVTILSKDNPGHYCTYIYVCLNYRSHGQMSEK